MKLKRPKNARTRLMLTLQLAVMLPAAVLVILSAWHLKTIQRDRAVEAAIQRDFRQVLAISEKQINTKLTNWRTIFEMISLLPAPRALRPWTGFSPLIPTSHI